MPITLNGTTGITDADGGTVLSTADFATLAEAQAGTDNTKLMTPLRAAQAITALTPAPTTAQVLSATAGASVGAVGTYANLRNDSAGTVGPGGTLAGSSLRYSDNGDFSGSLVNVGTWMSVGNSRNTWGGTWLRIS